MVWGRKEGERMPDDNARETSGARPAGAGFTQEFYDLVGGPMHNIEVHRIPVKGCSPPREAPSGSSLRALSGASA